MTPEQKMQIVVEAAGECWHEKFDSKSLSIVRCVQCSKLMRLHEIKRPSPTDLNELFRLAEKRYGTKTKISFYPSTPCAIQCAAIYPTSIKPVASASGNSKAEALLNAIYKSIQGES